MTTDPLDILIVDKSSNEVNLETLASVLKSYVRFTKEGELLFETEFYKLPEWKKVVIYLLSRKVISIKKFIENYSQGATTREISEVTGVPQKGIARDITRALKTVVRKTDKGYEIPNYNLQKCAEAFK